jgi:hypothetical protein
MKATGTTGKATLQKENSNKFKHISLFSFPAARFLLVLERHHRQVRLVRCDAVPRSLARLSQFVETQINAKMSNRS